jgi:hypothetical protein
MAAAAHRQLEPAPARRVDDRSDVGGTGDPRDRERPPVDSLEEDPARLVVGAVPRRDQLAFELGLKLIGRKILGLRCWRHAFPFHWTWLFRR